MRHKAVVDLGGGVAYGVRGEGRCKLTHCVRLCPICFAFVVFRH